MHNHQFIYLIFLTLCSSIVLMQGCSSDQVPKIVFSNNAYQFPGPLIVGSEITTTFSFINEGPAPLHILKIDSDCGCVATSTTSDKFLPSDKGKIRVAVERDIGRFHQNVFISTDDPTTPMVRLEVSGVIVSPVTYPKDIDLRKHEKGSSISKKIKLTNNLKDVVEITKHKVSSKSVVVTLPKKSIPSGKSIECEVVLTMNDVGLYREELTITALAQEILPGTDAKEFEMSIKIQGRVLGGIVVLPQNLFLGVLDGSGHSVQRKVQIKTDGSRPFALKRITSDSFSVSASLSQNPQTTHEVKLTITPKIGSKSSGLVEGTIYISTTHPDVPKITIPVKAVNP